MELTDGCGDHLVLSTLFGVRAAIVYAGDFFVVVSKLWCALYEAGPFPRDSMLITET